MDDDERRLRDAERKRRSRQLARQELAALVTSDERCDDWSAFRREVWRDLDPRGSVDGAICELVAAALWRMQRCVRLEAACLTRFMDAESRRRVIRVAKAQEAFAAGHGPATHETDVAGVVAADAGTISTFENVQDNLARYSLIESRLASELRRLLFAFRTARADSLDNAAPDDPDGEDDDPDKP